MATVASQEAIIKGQSSKIESYEEQIRLLKERVEEAEKQLHKEQDNFNSKLAETQKYFEETLAEREGEVAGLMATLKIAQEEISVKDNDLRQIIGRHEEQIQRLMEGGGNMQDELMRMMEQKVQDINEVLSSKNKVIQVRNMRGVNQMWIHDWISG